MPDPHILIEQIAACLRSVTFPSHEAAYDCATQLREVADRIENRAITRELAWWEDPGEAVSLSER